MFDYDKYNREERAICAHLFRLLHERLDDKKQVHWENLFLNLKNSD